MNSVREYFESALNDSPSSAAEHNAFNMILGNIPHLVDTDPGSLEHNVRSLVEELMAKHSSTGYLDEHELKELVHVLAMIAPYLEIPTNPSAEYVISLLKDQLSEEQEIERERNTEVTTACFRTLLQSNAFSVDTTTFPSLVTTLAKAGVLEREALTLGAIFDNSGRIRALIEELVMPVRDSLPYPNPHTLDPRQAILIQAFQVDDVLEEDEEHFDPSMWKEVADLFFREYEQAKKLIKAGG